MTGVCQKNMYLASGLQILIIGKAGLQIRLDGHLCATAGMAKSPSRTKGMDGSFSNPVAADL